MIEVACRDRHPPYDEGLYDRANWLFMSLIARSNSITQLSNSRSGRDRVLDRLIALLSANLNRVAGRHMKEERDGHVLRSRARVHEAFMRLGEQCAQWASKQTAEALNVTKATVKREWSTARAGLPPELGF